MQKLNSVLLIDDSEDDNFINKRIILKSKIVESEDFIFVKEDGERAYNFLSNYNNKEKYSDKFPPRLMFVDINMPKMNGFQFLEKFKGLKSEENLEPIIIVMLTTSQDERDIKRAKEFSEIKNYIVKPLTREILQTFCREYFHNAP